MSLRNELLDQLTANHPKACQLIVKLVQAIDLEKRQLPACDPEVQNQFCLSEMDEWVVPSIDNLSLSDATPVESDHAFRVIYGLFADLQSKGIKFESADSEDEIQDAGVRDQSVL